MNGLAQMPVDVYALNLEEPYAIEEASQEEARALCGALALPHMYKVMRYHYDRQGARIIRTLAYGPQVMQVIFPNKAAALIACDMYNTLHEDDAGATPLVA